MSLAQPLRLAGAVLQARGSGVLWWPEARLLCVADLHLGKSERLARRRGTLLPPYESRATLDRLAAEIALLDPATVVCLGDSFDDGAARPDPAQAARLAGLVAARDWIWIAGNHDPDPRPHGGRALDVLRLGPLTFRHEALADAGPGEISGHYHPKLRLSLKGLQLARPCFLLDARRLILPAFGTYTGGLPADHPAFAALLRPPVRAILTGDPCLALPLAG